MDLLRPTSFQTTCPFKGEASYWSADIGGQTHDGIVWGYEAPIPAASQIAGLLSFYRPAPRSRSTARCSRGNPTALPIV